MENIIRQITGLPMNQNVFVKKIDIPFLIEGRYIGYAQAIYARKLHDGYIMRTKRMNQLERCMRGYLEDEYPSDELDNCILSAIKAEFKDAYCHTSLQMFNIDKEENETYIKDKHKYNIFINLVDEQNHKIDSITLNVYTHDIQFKNLGIIKNGCSYKTNSQEIRSINIQKATFTSLERL